MRTVVLVQVVCACGFSGILRIQARCPSCGGPQARRLNRARVAALEAISLAGPDVPVRIKPATRMWLTRNLLVREVAADGGQPAARARTSGAPEGRAARFSLTEEGSTVLGIARGAGPLRS